MEQIIHKRWISILLTIAMILSMCSVPAYTYAAEDEVLIKDSVITPETTSITVSLSQVPALGILKIVMLDEEETYDSSKLNDYEALYFGAFYNGAFQQGENKLTLTGSPKTGKKLVAVVRDSSGATMQDYVSDGVIVTKADTEPAKTPEEILKNCSVQLMKDGENRSDTFRETETSTEVSVKLDDSVAQCHLTIFAYAGNTAFDPDASQNIRLWEGTVSNGYTGICEFAAGKLPLKVGYKIIACLNVPVGTDTDGDVFYRSVISQPLEVVDENGEGFKDYAPYPNVSIDETELKAGATSLHISLIGDPRLFEAAKEGKAVITCAIAQYPDGDDFDFESSDQISLSSPITVTEGFTAKEVKLSEPLKAGYRVRAVVYWSQNPEIFLPKGNDYEDVFHQPDDSVLVTGTASADETGVSIDEIVAADADTIDVTVSGDVPEGSTILLKSYDSDTTEFLMSEGTWVGSAFDVSSGTYTITPQSNSLTAGKKLVAFVQKVGAISAQSAPVVIQPAQPFIITPAAPLTAGSLQAVFLITAKSGSETNINVIKLCRVDADGKVDTIAPIKTLFGQKPGMIAFGDLPVNTFSAGDKVCLVLTYNNGDSTYTSQPFTVTAPLAENSLAIQETAFTVNSSSATVLVSGCDAFKGGRLILTVGSAENTNDADSRTQLASVSFTGEGTYQLNFDSSRLKAGETILPHLYIYDFDMDATRYQYGEPVMIKEESGQITEPKVEIATESIREDRTDLWAVTEFSGSLTGTLKLYTYSGEIFDQTTAKEIYSGQAVSSENSQRIIFGKDKLATGENLIAVLELSNGTCLQSDVKVIQAMPEKEKPAVQILDQQITAGDTYLKASLTFDSSISSASYVLYQFTEETLNTDTATVLAKGSLYRSETSKSIYLGTGRLVTGAKLQLVLNADGEESYSDAVTVEPSPDWGTPYAAFDVTAVKADAETIPVTIDYDDAYLSLGDDFFCDVSIYRFSSKYSDEEFEEKELWETYGLATRIGQVNSTLGQITKGTINVPVSSYVTLNPGDRLIIKLRLPHTEWDGEEVDYVSASVPIIGAEEDILPYHVVLYNLDDTSSRGHRLRSILNELGISVVTMEQENLNQTVGYLAGIEGYEAAAQPYDGPSYSSEFMLMCNLPESLLDRFLDAMIADGLRIDHKAIVTAYNRDYQFCELIGDIEEEHDTFQALIALSKLVDQAEALTEAEYGTSPHWQEFQNALTAADDLLRSEEPPLEKLQQSYETLKSQYLLVSGMEELIGTPVITIEKEPGGSYTLNAQLKDGTEEGLCQFTWSNGQAGKTISGIAAEDLIGTILTVKGDGLFGTLTAQLKVPEAPQAETSVKTDEITLRWTVPSAGENQPAPTGYLIEIYQDGKLVKTVETADAAAGEIKTVTIEQLQEGETYDIILYASSPVGRSDGAFLTVTTEKEQKNPIIVIPGDVTPGTPDNPADSDNPQQPGADDDIAPNPDVPDIEIDDPRLPLDKAPGEMLEETLNQTESGAEAGPMSAASPKTGDETQLLFWCMLLLLGSMGLCTGAVKEKRRMK